MTDDNPFAAPVENATATAVDPRRPARVDEAAIAAAIRRLDQHLAEPGAKDEDRRLAGGRLSAVTWTFLALTGAFALTGLAAVALPLDDMTPLLVTALIIGGICLIVAIVTLVSDLRVVARERATEPDLALRGWLAALRTGRRGYIVAACCPTAREREVVAPRLGPIPTPPGAFSLLQPRELRAWLGTFARQGSSMVRWMKVSGVRTVSVDGDVARVRADCRFQAWPQWANILTIVLFFTIRLLGLVVGAILFYSLRKRHAETLEKVLIRGQDGLWYVLDGDLIDGAGAAEERAA